MIEAKETKYAQLGIRIDPELLTQLSDQAKKEERSMSQVVRLAVRQYIASFREELDR